MISHCQLVMLILALTFTGQVHTGEVIGGHEAVPHSRPYMVLLERHMRGNTIKNCDGFLLNEDFVMTAAHCESRAYTVLLGVHDVRNETGIQRLSVKQAFVHKDYNKSNYTNDIMLLKLSTKAKFNTTVKPIGLAGKRNDTLPKSCFVSGWGITEANSESPSSVLREVNVTLTEECSLEKRYCSEGVIGPNKGDSGGPLVCENGDAYGIVSSALKPHYGQQINTFTKIPDYAAWIKKVMEHYGAKYVTVL